MTWILANASQVCNATEHEMMHVIPATRVFYYYVQSMRLKGVKTRMPFDKNVDEMTVDFFDKINKEKDNGTE